MSKALSQNATQLSMNGLTLENVDVYIPSIVKGCVRETVNQNTGTRTLSAGKGEQSAFARSCMILKSLLRIDRKEQLPDEVAEAVRAGVKEVFKSEIDRLFTEYQDHEIIVTDRKLFVDFDGDVATDAGISANVTMKRRNIELQEKRFACTLKVGQLQKRLATLEARTELDDTARLEIAKLKAKIESCEAMRVKWAEELAATEQ